ncbi:PAS domain S-box protein [Candidatus Nomurabacteria bacterium]|nr:PAS domain S-box protein [Candidatus Nomurabacteria bacterium]
MKRGGRRKKYTLSRHRALTSILTGVLLYGLIASIYGAAPFHSNWFDQLIMMLSGLIISIVAALLLSQITNEMAARDRLKNAQKRVKRERQALLTTINSASQAIFTIENNGTIGLYNSAFISLLDTNTDIAGKPIDEVMPIVDMDGNKHKITSLLEGSSRYETEDILLPITEEDSIRMHLTVNRVAEGFGESSGHTTYICTVRDITKEKSLEEERDEFISVVSHELRTPITIAEGSLDNAGILFDRENVSRDTVKKSIDLAHGQIVILAGMINDLSTLSRAERGVADNQEIIEVEPLAKKLYETYLEQAKEKKLHLNLKLTGKPGSVYASRLYLEELLQNFLTNAIKYTVKGDVTIQITNTKESVEFAIKDTGVGISKSDQAKIFKKFYRTEDYRTRETSGTGLGLYVASKLARKIGAKIDVKSRLNHGSTFSICIERNLPD